MDHCSGRRNCGDEMKKDQQPKEPIHFDDLKDWQKFAILSIVCSLACLGIIMALLGPIILAISHKSFWWLLLWCVPIGIFGGACMLDG